jgi:cytochrome c oxidase assembly factor CtaG
LRATWRRVGVLLVALIGGLLPGAALAHGVAGPAPGPWTVFTGWEFDPFFVVPVATVALLYLRGVSRVNRLHPKSLYPRQRVTYFFLGLAALVVANMSPLARYDTDLFAAHMVQHLLIVMVGTPLLLLGTPITLLLRASSPQLRREVLLPILHSRVLKAVSFPVLAWIVLAATMWTTHYSSLFDAALENEWLHRLEHGWYLGAAFLFWWPVVGADLSPWRLNHPLRLLYVFLQMPQNSFLAVSIYDSTRVIFPHYATLVRTWGPDALTDQEMAGAIMWVAGDLLFLAAFVLIAVGWVRHDEKEAVRQDRAIARSRAAAARASPKV